MNKSYIYHVDGGHGWLEVSREELDLMGIVGALSAYSYQSKDGNTVYLEEDSDAGLFVKAYREINDTNPKFVTVDDGSYSFIRKLQQFKP
jgi:hypothetical protein